MLRCHTGLLRASMILVVVLLAAACGSTGIGGLLATVTSSYADPTGDQSTTAGGTQYDVIRMITRRIDNAPAGSYDTLQVELTFAQAVLLPAGGSDPDVGGTQLAPYVAFDVDRNPATGFGVLNCAPSGGTGGSGTWTGTEFALAADTAASGFQRLANGNFRVVESTGLTTVGEATVSVSGTVLTINVPLSALGGDDGVTNAASTIGTRFGGTYTYTDCAPNPTGAVITSEKGGVPLQRK